MKTTLTSDQPAAVLSGRSRAGDRATRVAWIDGIGPRAATAAAALLGAALYAPSLGDGFLLDDYHHLARLEEVRAGRRVAPELFRFLTSAESNAAARRSGAYPWWIADEVRYQHWRPAAEWMLYGEYRLFGRAAWAYRAVNLALYAAGVALVLSLYRRLTDDEALARRAALLFAVLAGHAIPAVFISSQADLAALVLAAGACLAALRFSASGGAGWAALSCMLFGAGLGFKESTLPMAAVLVGLAWLCQSPAVRRRLYAAGGLWMALGLVWLAVYARREFGANNSVMLDPLHAPAAYLAALPGRAAILLSAMVIPVNPFIFYLRPGYDGALSAYTLLGAGAWLLLAWGVWKRCDSRAAKAAVLWPLPFLPLLACTVPDDRILMLPSIGFAMMAAMWWSCTRVARPLRARRILWLLAAGHATAALTASYIMGLIARDGRESVRRLAAAVGRPIEHADCIIFLNSVVDAQALFLRERLAWETGAQNPYAAFATMIEHPIVERVDDRTLRLRAEHGGLVDGFLGRMGVSWRRELAAGDEIDAGEFRVRVLEASGAAVRAIELTFAEPLNSGRYHFFRVAKDGAPVQWMPPPAPALAGAAEASG